MEFRIADTFTDSLARLTGDEQKATKTTAFDLQLNPASPGLSFHKLDRARDKQFWSVRVNGDIRLIVHRNESSILLCYVDHHDKAYDWAERRKLDTHPTTGAAQLVEIRESFKEVVVPVYIQADLPLASAASEVLFASLPDEELLEYGVPPEWLSDVRAATSDSLLTLADHLPAEAAEALLELATGGKPRLRVPAVAGTSPFEHPDAQRRFRVMTNVEELERALDFPWDKWTVFLHPEQRELVERSFAGPARVSGSAGTGKTIVALHRAVHLARVNPEARVLLTTFSEPLANALKVRLRRLLSSEPRLAERIDVHAIDAIGARLYRSAHGEPVVADAETVRRLVEEAAATVAGHKFPTHFLLAEWEHVVDAWQLDSWEAYRNVVRLGRKTRLSEAQRQILWSIFSRVLDGLRSHGLVTFAAVFSRLAAGVRASDRSPFDFIVVDEAQDLSVSQMRFLAAVGGNRANALFFAGDMGQRIFRQPFSWKALGVDIRGRSRNLRVNYRTSHQIRSQADRLLAHEVADADGNTETRNDTVSVFNGSPPDICVFASTAAEVAAVAEWIRQRAAEGIVPHEIGLFVRSSAEIPRAQFAMESTGLPFVILDENLRSVGDAVSVCTMHLAKGLEFRAVVVMACDDEVIPLQSRIESVGDEGDLQEVYDTERHLLYVACTRARDHLLVTGVSPISEFLEDLKDSRATSV